MMRKELAIVTKMTLLHLQITKTIRMAGGIVATPVSFLMPKIRLKCCLKSGFSRTTHGSLEVPVLTVSVDSPLLPSSTSSISTTCLRCKKWGEETIGLGLSFGNESV